ncbi:MAG: hypothetical protein WCF84_23235 [Anaerolineae bacterium]
MEPHPLTPPGKYPTVIDNVQEVALFGTADLAFWLEYLKPEGLWPYNDNGHAEVLISATDLKWMGKRFNEFTFSLSVCRNPDDGERHGLYLVHAYNSSSLLAFMERAFFQTPYYPARIQMQAKLPASAALGERDNLTLSMKMSGQGSCLSRREDVWEGPLYLPRYMTKMRGPGNFFFARLSGYIETYPFSPLDSFELKPSRDDRVLQSLVESHFTGQEWRIRANATHAKSKTYPRNGVLPG